MTDYNQICISGACQPGCTDYTVIFILGLVALMAIIIGGAILGYALWKQGRTVSRARNAYLKRSPRPKP